MSDSQLRSSEPPVRRAAVTIIDGRSGSGKTTFARALTAQLGAQTLHLDDLYPGWGGLRTGSHSVPDALDRLRYRRYDWERGVFADEVLLDPARPLVIEGCGAITAANLAAAKRFAEIGRSGSTGSDDAHARSAGPVVHSIWLECPELVRRDRALERDGEMFAPHWAEWAAQEHTHLRVERPLALAAEIMHCG